MASAQAEAFAAKHNAKVAADKLVAPPAPGGTPPAAGHNSGAKLKDYLKRLVALEQEKGTISEDIRELKAEAKAQDINPRALAVMAKRELEDAEKKAKRVAFEEVVDSYATALGFLD